MIQVSHSDKPDQITIRSQRSRSSKHRTQSQTVKNSPPREHILIHKSELITLSSSPARGGVLACEDGGVFRAYSRQNDQF